ncbi:hypothetical protein [Ruminiclostridium cellulolyticum]|uniref:Uncharacterized protein n=1 Tax=Ruminiclostridium cellulolyticum (strain ATCC 35319 / DSM 5812 / JCM 6584 / H10) TaxID=394503 RepID=B8I8E2_RUMCH|nr:hypothetical protein [Ruminiclostridium cellulolyticum]ACL77242.1 hypothetical protein Ccel_2948 [Ruminiclostridium cellulolyticum H10]
MQEENLTISIWDRESPINGVSAEEILSYCDDIAKEPVVLLFSDPDTGHVNQIQFPNTLVNILNTHDSFKPVNETDPIVIGHLYLQYLYLINHTEPPKSELQILQETVDTLVADNLNLQAQIDTLITSNLQG